MRWKITALNPVIIILLIIILFFASKWTFEGPYFKNDSSLITIPLENLYTNIQRSGQSPLWASELAGGYPLLAIGQLGFWYPPHMLMRQFLPAVVTLNISLLLHSILAALGIFFFLKHNKLGNVAATSSAILLPLSPVFVARYEMLNLVLPFSWLPVILLLVQLCAENPRRRNFLFLTATNFLLVLIGHPQMTVYVLLSELTFFLFLFVTNRRGWLKILLTGTSVFVAIGLSAFSFLPIVENLPNTDRANGSADNPYEFQLTPASLTGIFIAHPFGHDETYKGPKNEAELACYIGPFAFIFVLIGLIPSRKKFKTLFFISIIFILTGLVFGLGELSPFYRFLINHGWTYFGVPARFYFFIHFGLIFLCAVGIEYLVSIVDKNYRRFNRLFSILIMMLIIFPALFFSYIWTKNIPWKYSLQPALLSLLQNTQPERVASVPKENLIDMTPDNDFGIHVWKAITSTSVFRQNFESPYSQINGIAIKLSVPIIGTGKLSLNLFTDKGQIVRRSSIFAKKFIADDWNTFYFEPIKNAIDNNYYFELTSDMPKKQAPLLYIHTNPKIQYNPTGELLTCTNNKCAPVVVKQTADVDFKLVTEKEKSIAGFDTLAGHVASGYRLGSTFWIGALPILDVKNFFTPFEKGSIGNGDLWPINRFATKYVVGIFSTYRFIDDKSFQLENSRPIGDQFIRLYRNAGAFPRLSFFQNIKSATGSIEQLEVLKNLNQKNQATVTANTQKDLSFNTSDAKANFTKDDRTKIEIHTENSSEGFLVLRDVYLNGWYATIDKNPTKIYRTDSIFRGILVPAGNHTVTFQYKPGWIKTAITIEIISAVAFLGLIFVTGKYRQEMKSAKETTQIQ